MKITSFNLTIQQGIDEQGYADNFYISIDDKGLASISRPYKSIPVEEQLAIEEVITSAIKAHLKLVKQIDNANKDLRLEEYRPIESVESAASQSCALGGEELSTGAEVEIGNNNPVDTILATESSSEDGEAVAYFTEELSKIIDARKKKD